MFFDHRDLTKYNIADCLPKDNIDIGVWNASYNMGLIKYNIAAVLLSCGPC